MFHHIFQKHRFFDQVLHVGYHVGPGRQAAGYRRSFSLHLGEGDMQTIEASTTVRHGLQQSVLTDLAVPCGAG